MREFFHGWRRKAGVVTLVMACVLAVFWVRSFLFYDFLLYGSSEHQCRIASFDDAITIESWWSGEPLFSIDFGTPLNSAMRREIQVNRVENIKYGIQFKEFRLPYWAITIPLTLLSAYLMLWKPRKRVCPN